MKLVVGLGNPGKTYENTRHNIGALALDCYAKRHKLTFKLDNKFKGFLAEEVINNEKTYYLKPTTYMNLSGDAIIAFMNYYDLKNDDVYIIYDDVDLDKGVLRLREQGSAGGHNGLKSIISHIGLHFKRIRIGIDGEHYMNARDYVLGKITKQESKTYEIAFEIVADIIEKINAGESFLSLMNLYN